MMRAIQSFNPKANATANTSSAPAFRGNEITSNQQTQDTFEKKKDNTVKYAVGIGSVAAVIGLGIAGYKGKLGKTIQKWLGGAEKAAKDAASNPSSSADGVGGAGKTALEKYFENINNELKSISNKKVSELSDEELNKLVDLVFPEDMPVLKELFEKTNLKKVLRENDKEVGMFMSGHKTGLSEMILELNKTPETKQILINLLGKDSIMYRKLKDITVGDIKPILNKLSEGNAAAKKAGMSMEDGLIDKKMLAMLDNLDPSMKIDKIEELLGEKININHDKTLLDILAQFIRTRK